MVFSQGQTTRTTAAQSGNRRGDHEHPHRRAAGRGRAGSRAGGDGAAEGRGADAQNGDGASQPATECGQRGG